MFRRRSERLLALTGRAGIVGPLLVAFTITVVAVLAVLAILRDYAG
jgi:hypothetical protein